MERSKTAKFGFVMLRGALYVGNALTVGLLCFAAQILFYMLCFLAAAALFIIVVIVLPAALVIIGALMGSPELAVIGMIVALVVWGTLLACAAGVHIDFGIENCIQAVGQYVIIPWEYVNQKISTIGTENNQEQDHMNTNLRVEPMNNNEFDDKIADAGQTKYENNLKMSDADKKAIDN